MHFLYKNTSKLSKDFLILIKNNHFKTSKFKFNHVIFYNISQNINVIWTKINYITFFFLNWFKNINNYELYFF